MSLYRNFRTFIGHYVAHCHNLAHEDHAMMFGLESCNDPGGTADVAVAPLLAAAGCADREPLYYVDPMHPAYRSDKPGTAPDCGMPLVPVYEPGAGAAREHGHAAWCMSTPSSNG